MTKYLLPLFIVTSITVAQEVSVYDRSDSDGSNSYGLSSSEKHILKNQTNINNLSSKLGDINSLVESINRRLEGLESTYEGDSAKLNSISLKVNELLQKEGTPLDLGSSNVKSSGSSDSQLVETVNSLKAALTKLSTLVNKINSEYVSSTELEKNMQQFITREEFEALKKSMGAKTAQIAPVKTSESKSTEMDDSKKNYTSEEKLRLLTDAKKDYDAKNYSLATSKYEKLVELNYKPAESNFYLGQMWYIRKKYDVAINHFKKSAILNDKAAYMPTLLLHSAISFENTKDKENAKNFYNTLVELYPDSNESKTAKKNLSKLK